jgi:single-stranded-DNA-specific exonuclease
VVDSDPGVGSHAMLVVAGEGWHRGVIGIVASKLVEAYYKPSIVLSLDGETAHGSCRSIPGFDMLAALERVADLFHRFGGHRQAAGLTMDAARVPELRRRLVAHADALLDPEALMPRLSIDGALPLHGIDSGVIAALGAMAPFGPGNPQPLFRADGVEIVDGPRTMKDRHLSMTVAQRGRRFRAIAWRAAERAAFFEQHRAGLDVAFSLDKSTYQGESYLELTLADARARKAD